MTMLTLALIGATLSGVLAFWRRPSLPRYWPLLAIAVVPQIGSMLGIIIPGMFFIAIVAIGIWCLYNRRIAGAWIITIGVALNLLVMAWHGGAMPIRADVLTALGYDMAPGTTMMKDIVVETSPLWWLSDWIVLPLGQRQIIMSPGDVLIVAGITWWLLFSHPAEKEQARANPIDQTRLSGTAHTPPAGTE